MVTSDSSKKQRGHALTTSVTERASEGEGERGRARERERADNK